MTQTAQKVETKVCHRCQEDLPIDSFPFHNIRRTSRNKSCRSCVAEEKKPRKSFGLRSVNVPCRGCKKKTKIEIEPGTKAPPILCARCKEYGVPEHRGAMVSDEVPIGALVAGYANHGPVTIYRPGEPTFHFLAEQLMKNPPKVPETRMNIKPAW